MIAAAAPAVTGPAGGTYQVLKEEPVSKFALGPLQGKILFPALVAVTLATVVFFQSEVQPGLIVVPICAYVQAFRLSRVRGTHEDVRQLILAQAGSLVAFALATLVAFEIVSEVSSIWLIGGLAAFVYFIGILVGAVAFLFVFTAKWLVKPPPSKALPRVIVSIATLRDWRNENYADLKSLTAFEVFTNSGEGLADAWRRKALKEIEEYLKAGDEVTRRTADLGVDIYTRIVGRVDLARGNLKYLVEKSESSLSHFKIDYSTIKPDESKSMVVMVPIVTLRRDLSQRLDHGAFASRISFEAMRGNVPWYVAVAAFASAVIMNEVNKSKKLRQLKEMEGQVLIAAAIVRNDFLNACTALATRVIPQYDGLLDVITRLTSGLAILEAPNSVAPSDQLTSKQIFDMVCALVEGRYYLRMMGGD